MQFTQTWQAIAFCRLTSQEHLTEHKNHTAAVQDIFVQIHLSEENPH